MKIFMSPISWAGLILAFGMFGPVPSSAQPSSTCKQDCAGELFACLHDNWRGPATQTRCNTAHSKCLKECDVVPPTQSTGTLAPKYYILTVVYAPPGMQGGRSNSSVTYGSASTTGTTVSANNSFKQNYKVTATVSGGVLGALGSSGQVSGSFGYTRSASDTSQCDIKKSTTNSITVNGPSVDGIDHDRDVIYLWLNPKIGLTLTPTSASWTFQDVTADMQYVYVGHLKDPSKMPPGVAQRLQAYGITEQDYPTIMRADPFSDPNYKLDPARFQDIGETRPYEPPYASGDPVPTEMTTLSSTKTETSTTAVQNEYAVGATVSGDATFLSLYKASFKIESNWTWTDVSTKNSSSASSESASATIGGPAFGYIGPTDIGVYYDVVFKSFAFILLQSESASLRGTVVSETGKVRAGQEVVLVINGIRHRTLTNARGEYRMFGNIFGPMQLQAGGVTKQVPALPSSKRIDFVVP